MNFFGSFFGYVFDSTTPSFEDERVSPTFVIDITDELGAALHFLYRTI